MCILVWEDYLLTCKGSCNQWKTCEKAKLLYSSNKDWTEEWKNKFGISNILARFHWTTCIKTLHMQPALLLGSLPYFQQFVLINNFTVSNTFSRSKILGVLIKLIVDGTNMLKTLLLLLVKCTFEEREEFAHYGPTKYIYSSLEPCLMILVNST